LFRHRVGGGFEQIAEQRGYRRATEPSSCVLLVDRIASPPMAAVWRIAKDDVQVASRLSIS